MKTNLERIKNDIENLSKFNATPGKGLTRFSFTKEDGQVREYLKAELRKLDVEIYEDEAATLFAKRKGTDDELPPIMIGSHFDSVKNGGNFDGPAGVIMALEILRTLEENKIKTKYPIEFVAMIEEEGGRFGAGVFASRAMAGMVSYEELVRNKDAEGVSMAEAMEDFGFDPKKIGDAKRKPEDIKAFIEIHIEQGPLLESKNKDVGIVDYIVGINHINVLIKGRPDHAGTTPMDMRADAMDTAAKVIGNIGIYAIEEKNGTVATVGSLKVKPGATNIVAGNVEFTVDLRSKDYESIKRVKSKIVNDLEELTKDNDGLSFETVQMLDIKPVEMSKEILSLFEKNSNKNNFSYETMISGAGHDAMVMGNITDVGLIFVPSKDGRSHCPEEWTDYEDLQKGIELIYHTVVDLGEAQ
ncbi:MAG: Zn-dependent hydrolase [Bacillota bacterium]|nr:Zn-dependent hydrolase [Bacillota bacterium]